MPVAARATWRPAAASRRPERMSATELRPRDPALNAAATLAR